MPGRGAGGRSRRRRRRVRRLLLSAVCAVLALTGVAVAVSAWTAERVGEDVVRLPDVFPDGPRPEAAGAALTFLLVGLDRGAGDPGMLVLVRVTEDRRHLQLVSLPLSTWPGAGDGRAETLGDAFRSGGPRSLIRSVESLSDVRVDHYVELDLAAFGSLTETLGGINLDVPARHWAEGHDFAEGRQHVDGGQALAYMRPTRDASDGASALTRQHAVVRALFDRAREQGLMSSLGRLTGLVGLLTRSARFDDTVDNAELTRLAWDLRGVDPPELVRVPVQPVRTSEGRLVHRPDPAPAEALWTYLQADVLSEHLDEFR